MASNSSQPKDTEDALDIYPPSSQFARLPTALQAKETFRALSGNHHYKVGRAKLGHAVIFNFHNFHVKTGQGARDGTEVDAANLVDTLSALGFEVDRYDDLTIQQVFDVQYKYANKDHSDCDCLVVVYLSHGEDDRVYAHDGKFPVDDVMGDFTADRCPSLAGKPKLFFIQACRGRQYDKGVHVPTDELDSKPRALDQQDEVDAGPRLRRIPARADFLVAFSVVPGHYSWRNNVDGSWFVQALCAVLRRYSSEKDMAAMMTLVCRVVAEEFESDTGAPYTSGMKQVPSVVSTLTRSFFLRPQRQ